MSELEKHDLSTPPAGKTVIVETNDLTHMIAQLTRQTNLQVSNVLIPEGSTQWVVVFEHPGTGQMIPAAKHWNQRKSLTERLAPLKCLALK